MDDPSFLTHMWAVIKDDPTKVFSVVNSIIFLAGAIFTVFQIEIARKSRKNTTLSHVFAQLSEHNNQSANDQYRRRAVEQFSTLNIPVSDEKLSSDELSKLYWGTRAFHIGLINLLAQVWLLSGRPRNLRGNYEGWENLARAVVGDPYRENIGFEADLVSKRLHGPLGTDRTEQGVSTRICRLAEKNFYKKLTKNNKYIKVSIMLELNKDFLIATSFLAPLIVAPAGLLWWMCHYTHEHPYTAQELSTKPSGSSESVRSLPFLPPSFGH